MSSLYDYAALAKRIAKRSPQRSSILDRHDAIAARPLLGFIRALELNEMWRAWRLLS